MPSITTIVSLVLTTTLFGQGFLRQDDLDKSWTSLTGEAVKGMLLALQID